MLYTHTQQINQSLHAQRIILCIFICMGPQSGWNTILNRYK